VLASSALGCATGPEIDAPGSDAAPYRTIASVKETMNWILDPATDVIWESAGTIITAEGERELSPTTPEGWERVRRQAVVVAESGNLLMMPSRTEGEAWNAFAAGLIVAGQRAASAAAAHDADALFDAGGELYQVCRGCHARFMIDDEAAEGQ